MTDLEEMIEEWGVVPLAGLRRLPGTARTWEAARSATCCQLNGSSSQSAAREGESSAWSAGESTRFGFSDLVARNS
jgi:hypothetical protein